ncbi:unnamed protein product [Phytomonas sp. Hart1]|nr:unnamed protein product [Phytomonas sp. Hart1]|eukprot:CCW71397.1 unnamed protein product [Phytomonas sp. isolate Hart1]
MSEAGTMSGDILSKMGEISQSPQPSLPIEHLLQENVVLKSKLALSEDQRVIEDIMRDQLQSFLVAATEGQSQWNDGPNTTNMASFSAALKKLYGEKAELEAELKRTRLETTEMLNGRIDELEQDRKVLQIRLQNFEMQINDGPPRPYVVELEQLRESEALLRQQLKSTREENIAILDKLKEIFAEELAVFPTHIAKAEAAKAALQESHKVHARLKVEIEEEKKRFEILHELHESRVEDERYFHCQEILTLRELLTAALERENVLVKERAAFQAQIAAGAQREADESKPMYDSFVVQERDEEESFASKRQRVEPGQHSQPNESIRMKYVHFWHDGHARVAALEQRVRELESTETAARVLQGRMAQFERDRTNLTAQLVNLADALIKVRETNHQLRAQYVGLEVERNQLLARLTEALEVAMQPEELVVCSNAIREAASRQSAASATTVADPDGLQQAMRQTRELKSEIVRLQRQKENLLRCITLREERVSALLKREVMLVVEGDPCNAIQTKHKTTPWPKLLELVEQSAKDIFTANEAYTSEPHDNLNLASETKGKSRHHGSFLAIQQELNESQVKLRDSYLKLQESKAECQHLTADLVRVEAEKSELLVSKNVISETLRASNVAIESLTNRLASQHAENNSVFMLQRQTQTAFACVFELYRAETQYIEKLCTLVRQEREDIIELVRRETQAWLHVNDVATHEHPVGIKSIVDTLERLNISVQDGVTQAMFNNSAESTKCLAKLAEFVKDQEKRLNCLQKAYAESTTQLATSLTERIINARNEWESQWRDKHRSLEREYAKLSLNSFATQKMHEALEQLSVEMNLNADILTVSSPFLQEIDTVNSISTESVRHALSAISAFLDTLRSGEVDLHYPNEWASRNLPDENASSMLILNETKDMHQFEKTPSPPVESTMDIEKKSDNEQREHI